MKSRKLDAVVGCDWFSTDGIGLYHQSNQAEQYEHTCKWEKECSLGEKHLLYCTEQRWEEKMPYKTLQCLEKCFVAAALSFKLR